MRNERNLRAQRAPGGLKRERHEQQEVGKIEQPGERKSIRVGGGIKGPVKLDARIKLLYLPYSCSMVVK